ncbi:DUF2059 domain-containing protein [Mangrovitalea sediminis]|uniref:DUF2059 domain-containing protein n=1 Tax=Mangrovitalea sediminis TaxID=1982043 RepID=UPI000BE58D7F|nr:DUF2059 domain-containing protein [Mangrovitalea sediminis]
MTFGCAAYGRRWRTGFYGSLMLLMLAWGLSPPVMAADGDWGHRLVQDAAIPQRLAPLPGFVQRQVSAQLAAFPTISPQIAQLLGGALAQAYDPSILSTRVSRQLDQSMTDTALRRVDQWYRSSLGRKVVRLEVAASNAALKGAVLDQAGALAERFRGSARAELFQRYDHALKATQRIVDTSIDAQTALATLVPGQDKRQLHQRLTSQRPVLLAEVRRQVYEGYLYTYRDLTIAELRRYIGFLESADTRRYTDIVAKVAHDAVVAPIDGIGRQWEQLKGLQGLL